MTMSGGCQCGRVRYEADIDGSADAYLCHCSMCRRATGGASIAFVSVPAEAMRWLAEPDWYASSPIARRPFCAQCGTPLGFSFVQGATGLDVTLGSFDDPGVFTPTRNFAVESVLPRWQDTSHLPGKRTEENPNVADRWRRAGLDLPG